MTVFNLQVIINFCMAALEYDMKGSVSVSMILVCVFQFVYVADCLWFEVSLLKWVGLFRQERARAYIVYTADAEIASHVHRMMYWCLKMARQEELYLNTLFPLNCSD